MILGRQLYDEEFLLSGCDPSLFDDLTNVDNTRWTFLTSYAIAGVSFLYVGLLYYARHLDMKWMIAYFVFSGIGHSLAGLSHHLPERKDEASLQIPGRFSNALFLLANFALQAVGVFRLWNDSGRIKAAWIVASAIVAVIVLTLNNLIVLFLWVAVTYVFMFLVYARELRVTGVDGGAPSGRTGFLMKATALVLMLVGGILQAVLSFTCGAGGYEDCFAQCPMRNPAFFNHNAVFHLLLILGQTLLGAGELREPLLLRSRKDSENNEDTPSSSSSSNVKTNATEASPTENDSLM